MICRGCNLEKDSENFPRRKDNSGRLRPYCYLCLEDIGRIRYAVHKEISPFKLRASKAKSRSQHLKVPYNLTPEYLEELWTGVCPILNIPISFYSDRVAEDSAELDRYTPSLGYVKGNVFFLSRRANRIKNDATFLEIKNLYNWMKNNENNRH